MNNLTTYNRLRNGLITAQDFKITLNSRDDRAETLSYIRKDKGTFNAPTVRGG